MNIYRLKGTSGPVVNQSFALGERLLIGSAGDCDVRLEHVAGHHVEVVVEGTGAVVIRSLETTAEILLNGEIVSESHLAGGDEIRIGNCRFILQAPGLRPERLLTEQAVRPRRSYLPWLVALAAISAAVLAWQRGWLTF